MSPSVKEKSEDSPQKIRHAFEQTVSFLNEQNEVGQALQEFLSNDEQLQLYGLYKQSTACMQENNVSSWWNPRRRAKRFAWQAVSHLSREEAMHQYLQRLLKYSAGDRLNEQGNEYIPQQVRTLHQFVLSFLNENADIATPSIQTNELEIVSESVTMRSRGKDHHRRHSILEPLSLWLKSLLTETLGVVPLQPRGHLDISYQDLRFAFFKCLLLSWRASASKQRQLYCQYESDIKALWLEALQRSPRVKHIDMLEERVESEVETLQPCVVVGLSVRTLLDLYLRVQKFPEGSEVIVSPPINVPGMIRVFHHHGLKLVGVDLAPVNVGDPFEISVNMEGIEQALNASTVAILIVHVFGMVVATDEDMKRLRSLVGKRDSGQAKIAILEDCAECFTGLDKSSGGYLGSPYADVSFFSFGLIKTLTAVNGGVAVVRRRKNEPGYSANLLDSMSRLHNSYCYESYVSNLQYLQRICKCFLLLFIGDAPLLYGLLYSIVSTFGFDFDSLVTWLLREFHHDSSGNLYIDGDGHMILQIRRKPSPAMLALLRRRLLQRTSTSVARRMKLCKQLTDFLLGQSNNKPGNVAILRPKDGCKNFFWLFPVCARDPEELSLHMRRCGFDATRGTSQLCCLPDVSCPVARKLMKDIVYLPVFGNTDVVSRGRNGPFEVANAVEVLGMKAFLSGKKSFSGSPVELKSPISLSLFYILVFAAVGFFHFWLMKFLVCSVMFFMMTLWFLRWTMGEFYLNSSKGFASHISLLYDYIRDDHLQKSVDSSVSCNFTGVLSSMGWLSVPGKLSGQEQRSVFLTGVTGYVGSMLLRDLMFYREELGIDRIVLLCRAKKGKSARCRVAAILDHVMYSFLSSEEKKSLVRVVDGDITMPLAGLSDAYIDELIRENSKFTHLFHCAASVSFTQSLPDAAAANILSSLNVQNLSTLLSKEKVQFVYISTAFVHGGRFGSSAEPLPEELCDLAQFDPFEIYRSMVGTQYYASLAMHELSFPNTYTFSKCICEHLLISNDTTTMIIRPSIVGPALEFPYEGWAGRTPSTLVAAACLYLSFQWNLWSFGSHRVPHIPIDVLTRFVVTKAFTVNTCKHKDTCSLEESASDEGYEKVSKCLLEKASSVSSDSGVTRNHQIFNATWNTRSTRTSTFTWFEYAGAITQLGSILGYFSRPTAYCGLLIATRILPKAALSTPTFEKVHKLFVKSPFEWTIRFCRRLGYNVKHLERLHIFLDLPLLFYPFMNNSYYFQSELTAPSHLDGERYLVNCVAAAHIFAEKSDQRLKHHSQSIFTGNSDFMSLFTVCGRKTMDGVPLLCWAVSQPQGNVAVRFVGWLLALILPRCFSDVTVDLKSFSAMQRVRRATGTPTIVLVPTHRSMFDFLLLSFVCFSVPELQMQMPHIAAADIFERLPFIGWLLPFLGAFFVRRGRKTLDSGLIDTVSSVKDQASNAETVVEVFIEGTRSRDRRFVSPRTGVLRCLQDRVKKQIVVPVTISYERIAEQESLVREVSGGQPSSANVGAMLSWYIVSLSPLSFVIIFISTLCVST
jgi:dTDP-4-amino-4,6-dideoxygalactose transaminase/1-acyl-sn-glycerol-3-phosphate acyltransferase/nucleoside-diphosphate-sugar epimerase/acyl-CoA-binding protein